MSPRLQFREKALKEEERTKRKARRRFNEILEKMPIRNTSTWESVQKRLPKTADVQYLPLTDAERLDVFNEHMKQRAMDNDFDSASEFEEGEHARRRKVPPPSPYVINAYFLAS